MGATFVYDFPEDTSPLTRYHRSKPGLTEKWDLYVRGFETATAYSELADPVVQRERFEAQALAAAKGDPEAMVLDEDFLVAMEQGFPPSGGMGMGIDRLLMVLTGQGIRETITFPWSSGADPSGQCPRRAGHCCLRADDDQLAVRSKIVVSTSFWEKTSQKRCLQ